LFRFDPFGKKRRCSCPIFLCEADTWGISATGEEDSNELYPDMNFPPEPGKSCRKVYREYRENPESFLLAELGT